MAVGSTSFDFTPLCVVVSDLVIPIWCYSGPVLSDLGWSPAKLLFLVWK